MSRCTRKCSWACCKPSAACRINSHATPRRQPFVVFDQMIEIDAVDVFHHEIQDAVLAVGFVSPHDVGMVQPAREFDLHRKAVDVVLVEIARQDLDGPVLFEKLVPGFINHAHPAPAAGFDDLVRTDPHPSRGRLVLQVRRRGTGRRLRGGRRRVLRFAGPRLVRLPPADAHHQLGDGGCVLRKAERVFLRRERVPRLRPVIQFQPQEFFEQPVAMIRGHLGQGGFDFGRFAGFEEAFKGLANAVDAHAERDLRR